jgi:hypothetical protein
MELDVWLVVTGKHRRVPMNRVFDGLVISIYLVGGSK